MSFNNLGLRPEILAAITKKGYKIPTPIQEKAIPLIIQGKDVLGKAQTGTGKTAAFGLPILHILSQKKTTSRNPRALILTPTRELAAQVEEYIENYNQAFSLKSVVIFGGVKINPQITKLRAGVDIVVATPGRLLDHVKQRTLNLSEIEILVFDEADRMLDMGFIHDIRKILSVVPKVRQTLFFSATYSPEIKKLTDTMLHNPVTVEVSPEKTTAETVEQVVYPVNRKRKTELLIKLINEGEWTQVLVFTRTKHGANKLTKSLLAEKITAAAIHGNKSQGARTRALAEFKKNEIRVLVATDIAARGIDISQLPHVVNYELPDTPESYIHRIGRTGRAGTNGTAISLVCPGERKELVAIHKLLKTTIPSENIEGFTVVAEEDEPKRRRSFHAKSSNGREQRSANKSGFEHRTKSKKPGNNHNWKKS